MRLRPDVTVRIDGPQRRALEDHRTDFVIVLDGEDVGALDALAAGDAAPAALGEMLSELGLLDEGLSDDQIRARQRGMRLASRDEERWEALRDALRFAYERVPWHRDRMNAAGVKPDDIDSLEVLARIPVMTKADIRARFPDGLLAEGVDLAGSLERGALILGATSGTTDERLQVIADPGAGALPNAIRELWGMDPRTPLNRGAILTSPLCVGNVCHLGDMSMEERTHGVTLTLNSSDDIMGARDEIFAGMAHELSAFGADVFFVNPWYAMWLTRKLRALQIPLPKVSVLLSGYQLLPKRHRRVLEEEWGAPVFSYYSASELGGYMMGTECGHRVMHLREDDVFIEVVPHKEDPSIGSVVVTSLRNRVTPLVRYVVGDVARRLPTCSCARGIEWPALRVEGRLKDLVRARSGALITPAQIDDAIGDETLDFYRLVQRTPARFTLEGMEAAPGGLARARDSLLALLGDVRVDVDAVRRFTPERSLKFRTTVNEVPA